jgi:hypothetical protein
MLIGEFKLRALPSHYYYFFLKKRQIVRVSLDETINTITKSTTNRQAHKKPPGNTSIPLRCPNFTVPNPDAPQSNF